MIKKRAPIILLGVILILSIGLSSCGPADTPQPTEAQAPEESGQVASDVSTPSEEYSPIEFQASQMPPGLREEPTFPF